MNSDFSLVIINYNGASFIERTLKNLEISNLKPNRIIVVDDGSSDNSVNLIRKNFPEIIIVENKQNLGPVASRNRGAKLAKDKYIIFMDNDVFIKKDTFSQLVNFAEEDSNRGIVSAKIIPQGKEKMWWNMGYDPNDFREIIGYFIGFLLKIFGQPKRLKVFSMKFILNYWGYNKSLIVDWVVETCFLIREDIFNKVGGFDEKFFMFFEGPDICRRVRKAGFKVFFNPKAKVNVLEKHVHPESKRRRFWWKSKKYFYKKHYSFIRRITLYIGTFLSYIFCRIA